MLEALSLAPQGKKPFWLVCVLPGPKRSLRVAANHATGMLCLVSLIAGCMLDGRPLRLANASPDAGKTAVEVAGSWGSQTAEAMGSTKLGSSTPSGSTAGAPARADDDDAGAAPAAKSRQPAMSAMGQTAPTPSDAGAVAMQRDATIAMMPTMMPPTGTMPTGSTTASDPNACDRAGLKQAADAYLQAMASGSAQSLMLHPSLRYTENGEEVPFGAGLWLSRAQPVVAWHALDEQTCASATEAVLQAAAGQIIFAVRLRYTSMRLAEAEALVVRQNLSSFAPQAIIATGAEVWEEPLPAAQRQDATALTRVVESFLESAIEPSLAPPAAASCKLRQNGVEAPPNGSCILPKDGDRFDQGRFPVTDVSAGVAVAVGRRRGYLIMLFAKIKQGTVYNLDAVGGMMVATTGW